MNRLPKEIEEGNIEYKRFLRNVDQTKLNHLTAQMNWRLNEGCGNCHYYLGICDDGSICKDFSQYMDYTLDIIKVMIDNCKSYIDYIKINKIDNYIWIDVHIIKYNIDNLILA